MLSYLALLHLFHQAGIAYPQTPPADGQPQGQRMTWGPCDVNATSALECGNVTVPLDYTDLRSNKTLQIELIKSPATKKPSKGSILMNFGGPGGSSRLDLAAAAPRLQDMTGGHHDLVSFDQRGTGKTMFFSCFKDEAEKAIAMQWATEAGNASDISVGKLWAASGIIAESCVENAKDIGRLIGLSYGSALGQTAAAMFPDKVDKVILDANLNPHEYWHGHDVEMYADTDKVFVGFVSGCVAAPDSCALARNNATEADIEKAIYDLMETLKYDPVGYKGRLLDWSALRGNILGFLYSPTSWPMVATVLDGVINGNLTVLDQLPDFGDGTADRRFGIVCSDKTTRGEADAMPAVQEVMNSSKVAGDVAVHFITQCAQWQMEAKERYDGDFQVKTANPVLLLQNTFDPVTPLRSAHNMSTVFEGSVVLEQNGYGHGSLAQPSICTAKALQAYLMNGTMPQPGTVCEVDVPLFSNKTWEEVFV